MSGQKYTQEQIDEIAELLKEGLSAAKIGARVKKTRNAIIGVVARNEQLSAIGFARKKGPTKNKPKRVPEKRVAKKSVPYKEPTPLPVRELDLPEPKSRKIGLLRLNNNQCRWPTDRVKGEHLFCGHALKSGSRYCAYHCELGTQLRRV